MGQRTPAQRQRDLAKAARLEDVALAIEEAVPEPYEVDDDHRAVAAWKLAVRLVRAEARRLRKGGLRRP